MGDMGAVQLASGRNTPESSPCVHYAPIRVLPPFCDSASVHLENRQRSDCRVARKLGLSCVSVSGGRLDALSQL